MRVMKVLYSVCAIFVSELTKKQETMSSKIYPIGIQNFESLRKDGFFYIDKTEIIYRLVKTG